MQFNRHRPDFILLIVILLLVSIGLLSIYSASIIWAYQQLDKSPQHFFIRQCIFTIMGLVAMFITMNFPFWNWRKLLVPMLFISFVMLLLVFAFPGVNGAHRWIMLGGTSGGFTIQPSELAMLTIVIYMAHILTKKKDKLDDFKHTVIPPIVIVGVFAGLIILEPDMDTAALLVVIALSIIFSSGVPLKYLFRLLVPAVVLAAIFIFTSDYRRVRVFGFLDPFSNENFLDSGYQQANSLYAIASGGWWGKGLGRSIEKFLYLPEPHTDFIFAIFLEEWGTIGGFVLIALFAILIGRAIRIVSTLNDRFGSLVGIGITAMIGFAVLANMGMVTGTFPVMGIPLPFISYGGNAIIIKMATMGILLNLSRYTTEP